MPSRSTPTSKPGGRRTVRRPHPRSATLHADVHYSTSGQMAIYIVVIPGRSDDRNTRPWCARSRTFGTSMGLSPVRILRSG